MRGKAAHCVRTQKGRIRSERSKNRRFNRLPRYCRNFLSILGEGVFTCCVMKRAGLLLCALFILFATAGGYRANALNKPLGYNLNGQPITSLTFPGTRVVVLFFAATDCPICNRYIPEMQNLESKYSPQHVVMWYVYPNPGETSAGVRQHEVAYGAETHILLDRNHTLVKFTHAVITPEAVILVPEQSGAIPFRVVYRGRIDNRYIQLGEQRPMATQFDLERAIDDVLQNRPVQRPDGPPVGCWIIGQ